MKNYIIAGMVLMATVFISCGDKHETKTSTEDAAIVTLAVAPYIEMDSANKMIGSYLNSINYTNNDTDVRSFVINMNQLRAYCDSSASPISHVKVMFGHTLQYINSGKGNHNAGYRSGALTVVIAAYNSSGDYFYINGDEVMDYSAPCPTNCPPGDAANPFLTE